jgi:hypothetical protein
VPAAAVRRRRRALSGFTGRKAHVGGCVSPLLKPLAQLGEVMRDYTDSRAAEARGTPGVAVECVEIGKNTRGEGDVLGCI